MGTRIHVGQLNVYLAGRRPVPSIDLAFMFGPQTREPAPMAISKQVTIGDGSFPLVLSPQHNGRMVPVDGPARITLEEPGLFDVTQADDAGLVWRFRDKGIQGTTRGVAIVDARLGPEVVEKAFEFELTAALAEADQLLGEFRDQVPDDAPAPPDEAVPQPAVIG